MLNVENLEVTFARGADAVQAVRGVSFNVAAGESYGIVGESALAKPLGEWLLGLGVEPQLAGYLATGLVVPVHRTGPSVSGKCLTVPQRRARSTTMPEIAAHMAPISAAGERTVWLTAEPSR